MSATSITIEIDDARLGSYSDSYLATAWHVAQANPAPHGDHAAGELVERIGREIIRRWLAAARVELWNHQGRSYYWSQLAKLATFHPGPGEPGSPQWHDGVWVSKPTPTDGDDADGDDAGDGGPAGGA